MDIDQIRTFFKGIILSPLVHLFLLYMQLSKAAATQHHKVWILLFSWCCI